MTANAAATDVLGALQSGRREALDALLPLVYQELRAIAHRQLRVHERRHAPDATLATTALVHEIYVKLVDQSRAEWSDRAHFLALCAVAMRHLLTDRARARVAKKRGGARIAVTLDDGMLAASAAPETLLEIDDAMRRLATLNARLSRVVECRFFGDMSEEETATALSVTVRTVQRDWIKARALLQQWLGERGA